MSNTALSAIAPNKKRSKPTLFSSALLNIYFITFIYILDWLTTFEWQSIICLQLLQDIML